MRYSLRLLFLMYFNYYFYSCCWHFFVRPVNAFDFPKWKFNQNMGVGSTRIDEKIRNLHIMTGEKLNLYATAQWNYHTNRNDETTREALNSSIQLFLYQRLLVSSVQNMSQAFGMNHEDLLPWAYFLRDHSVCEMDLNDFKTIITLKSKLKTTVGGLTFCEYRKTGRPCDMSVDEMYSIMANSSDAEELKHYWKAWHNHTSYEVKNTYVKYIGLLDNMAKQQNNVSNAMEYYRKPYLNKNCNFNFHRMYEVVRPLYLQLFTRVRKALRDKFGTTAAVSSRDPIPVHLMGSVLGQPWTNLLPYMVHERYYTDATNQRTNAKTAKQLFDRANGYFTSIGMGSVPKNVWSQSLFNENERFADCTPSSWDMYKNNDFRIKMCFRDTVEDVYTIHKQLGLVHYFSAYKKQPVAFQHIPDAVFVEGILNALTLSVRYREFVNRYNDSTTSRHAYLLQMALEKVAVLPYAYAADTWHSAVFKGFGQKRMNDYWWSVRHKYEGVVSPISKLMDKSINNNYQPFDPSASYNTLTELPALRYFLAPIVEFQIFKALCVFSGEYGCKNSNNRLLYECNLRGYREVGKIIKSVMAQGSSVGWPFLFETIVGHQRLEAEPLLEYFKPLYDHLRETNKKTCEYVGWK